MTRDEKLKKADETLQRMILEAELPPAPPSSPTADAYRIAGYADGLVGAARPGCDLLLPHFDSGLRWADANNIKPDDPLWDGGVAGGVDLGRHILSRPRRATPTAGNYSGAPTSSPAARPA